MPLMTEPLAHVEGVLSGVEFDLEQIKRERMKLDAKFEALNEFRERLRTAIEAERVKLGEADSRRASG